MQIAAYTKSDLRSDSSQSHPGSYQMSTVPYHLYQQTPCLSLTLDAQPHNSPPNEMARPSQQTHCSNSPLQSIALDPLWLGFPGELTAPRCVPAPLLHNTRTRLVTRYPSHLISQLPCYFVIAEFQQQ